MTTHKSGRDAKIVFTKMTDEKPTTTKQPEKKPTDKQEELVTFILFILV